jgi:hypothetical protein
MALGIARLDARRGRATGGSVAPCFADAAPTAK